MPKTYSPGRMVLLILLGSSLLAGCTTGALSIHAKVTLQEGEFWKAESEIVFARLQMELDGGTTEQTLAQLVQTWQAQGIRASYRKKNLGNDTVQFRVTASGQGFDRLNATFFSNQAEIWVDESLDPAQITCRSVPLGPLFGASLSRTFTLEGGEILATNGTRLGRNRVIWTNPAGVMEATLTPAARFAILPLLLGVGGLGLLVAVGVGLRIGRNRNCPACGLQIPRRAEFCPGCGVSQF